MMNDILFVSDTEILPELELAQNEMVHYGYSLSFTVSMSKTLDYLKATTVSVVLINAHNKKIEAYELCKDIKESFRGAIKVIVFLPESTANEGSRFGLVNAEVEDSKTIQGIVDKLPKKNTRDYILDENVLSFYSLDGGCGATMMTILAAYVLDYYQHDTLVLESSNTLTIKNKLAIRDNKLPLLTRDKAREYDQAKDVDWFNGFVSKSKFIPRLNYLNLFKNSLDKTDFVESSSKVLSKLSEDIESFLEKEQNFRKEEVKAQLFGLANSLKLITRDIQGDSYSLFDEIVQLGSKVAKTFLFDISSDICTPLNKQLLGFSNNIIVIFKDAANIKEEYLAQKKYFTEKYKLNVIPVIAPPHYYYAKYDSLTEAEWMQVLGDVPLVYPYDPEAAIRFMLDKENLDEKSKLFKFTRDLLSLCSIPLKSEHKADDINLQMKKRSGILNFLAKQ